MENKYKQRLLSRTEFGDGVRRADEILPKRLRGLRKASGYTLEDVEEDTGIAIGVIGKFERGVSMPELYALVIFADYYGVSLDWLCGRDDYNG